MQAKKARLTEGPIGPTLARLAIPMVVGILGMVAFHLVDTYFVGHLGTQELAAMGFTFPVVFVVNGLALGLGIGTSAVVSRAIGRGDQQEVRRLTTDSLVLALLDLGKDAVAEPVAEPFQRSGDAVDIGKIGTDAEDHGLPVRWGGVEVQR